VGRSVVEEDKVSLAKELIAEAVSHGVKVILPEDHVTGDLDKKNAMPSGTDIADDRIGLDIGSRTMDQSTTGIGRSKMVLWNGSVGLFEVQPFDRGSRALAICPAENGSKLVSVIAGGDTVAAVTAAGVADRITHLSTGGRATLEFLEGRRLPRIVALEENA
jgi:phosphoglycerate kinase